MRTLCLALLLVTLAAPALADAGASAPDYLNASPADLQWFRDAKFGVFICWGPCSLVATEIGWGRDGPRPGIGPAPGAGVPADVYDNLYRRFDPERFDAREWARIVRASGARYVIFLTRHHDGFSMFDTDYSDYKVTNTPYGRDVTKELADAFHEAGIRIFWYYSQPDWLHPDYLTENHARYVKYMHNQVRELLTNYGKIDGMWFDGLQGTSETWQSPELFRMIRELQPHILINNRAGFPGDFDTPEQRLGSFQITRAWESCITMSTGWSWQGEAAPVKSLKECLDLLIRCAGGGGNLALDTGPMPDGRIAPEQAKRYREMGRWLGRYGESIYATTGGPYMPGRWGVSTRKGRTVYLHVLDWLGGEVLALPSLGARIVSCRALTGGRPEFREREGRLEILLRRAEQSDLDSIIALTLDRPAEALAPIVSIDPAIVSQGKPASASGEWNADYSAAMAFDGSDATRWGGVPDSRSGWLEVDLGAPTLIDRVAISEAPWNRVQRFTLEALEGGEWRTLHEGTTLGDFRVGFPPVMAERVRLNVLEASEVPTIWEFQVFAAGK